MARAAKSGFFLLALLGRVAFATHVNCKTNILGQDRDCCNTTGVCQSCSCTVFGFANSERATCKKNNCPDSKCGWINATNCPGASQGDTQCWGYVVCEPANATCYGLGELCLADGASGKFKICADECQGDGDCPADECCVAGPHGGPNQCVGMPKKPLPSPSPSRSPSTSPVASQSALASASPKWSPSPRFAPSPSPEGSGGSGDDDCLCPAITAECTAEELKHKGFLSAHLDGCIPEDTLAALAKFGCTRPNEDCTIIVCEHHIDDLTLQQLGTTPCPNLI